MRKRRKRALLVLVGLLGITSVGLNVMLIEDALHADGASLSVFDPRDTFDERSVVNELSSIGSIFVFAGSGELAPQWVRCTGQEVTRGEFPELAEALQRGVRSVVATDQASLPVRDLSFRLPDSRDLCGLDFVRMIRTAQPSGLGDRLSFAVLSKFDRRYQQLFLVPSGAQVSPDAAGMGFDVVFLGVRARK